MNVKIKTEGVKGTQNVSIVKIPSEVLLPGTAITLPVEYQNKMVTFFVEGKKVICYPLTKVVEPNKPILGIKSEKTVLQASSPKMRCQAIQVVHSSPVASSAPVVNTESKLYNPEQVMYFSPVDTYTTPVVSSQPPRRLKHPKPVPAFSPIVPPGIGRRLDYNRSLPCMPRRANPFVFTAKVTPHVIRTAEENILRYKTKGSQRK